MVKPGCIADGCGNEFWHLDGELHREDGPAVKTSDGDKFWYLNGKIHREDGPAVEYADGDRRWYLAGKICTFRDLFSQAGADIKKKLLLSMPEHV